MILPITHTPRDEDAVGVEVPKKVRAALGLDDAPSWVIVSEHNVDEWPNAGLAPLPGRPGVFSYGLCPAWTLRLGEGQVLGDYEGGRSGGVRR